MTRVYDLGRRSRRSQLLFALPVQVVSTCALLLAAFGAHAADGDASPAAFIAAPPAVAEVSGVRKMPVSASATVFRRKRVARLDLQSRRFADAYHRLRPYVADARGDRELLALLALAAMGIGRHGDALVIYEHLARAEPERASWRIGVALAREQLGLDATGAFRQALALTSVPEIRELLRAKLEPAEVPGIG